MPFDPNKQLPGGPKTVNDAFFDIMVRHQIGLLRLSGSVRNDILKILDETEGDLNRLIRKATRMSRNGVTPANLERLKVLRKAVNKLRKGAWDKITVKWLEELRNLSVAEVAFMDNAIKTTSLVILDTVLPNVQTLTAMVTSRPFEGKVLRDWARDIRRADLDRITGQVRIGMVQGESSQQIARRVAGSARLRGTNGVTEITRKQAAGITRTAVNAISNQARREYAIMNKDIFNKEQYVATLDGRTTPICRSLDGRIFPVGEGSIPPVHFNCRSLRVAVIDGVAMGRRPSKPSTERMLLKEFTVKEGLPKTTKRANLPRGTKGDFDKFSRKRIRELTGTVTGKTTYQQFLQRQPASFQDDVLGKTKGKLFRRGGLTVDRFVNRKGDELTLRQLAQRDRQAFFDSGLDPDDFT